MAASPRIRPGCRRHPRNSFTVDDRPSDILTCEREPDGRQASRDVLFDRGARGFDILAAPAADDNGAEGPESQLDLLRLVSRRSSYYLGDVIWLVLAMLQGLTWCLWRIIHGVALRR